LRRPTFPSGKAPKPGARRNPRLADDAIDIQIRPHWSLALAHHIGLIGFEAVHRVTILLRVDSHRAHAQLGRGTENADRDFAAVRRKKFLAGDRHGLDGRRGRLRGGGFHEMKIEFGLIKPARAICNLSKKLTPQRAKRAAPQIDIGCVLTNVIP
jgi:hypothetical protein